MGGSAGSWAVVDWAVSTGPVASACGESGTLERLPFAVSVLKRKHVPLPSPALLRLPFSPSSKPHPAAERKHIGKRANRCETRPSEFTSVLQAARWTSHTLQHPQPCQQPHRTAPHRTSTVHSPLDSVADQAPGWFVSQYRQPCRVNDRRLRSPQTSKVCSCPRTSYRWLREAALHAAPHHYD